MKMFYSTPIFFLFALLVPSLAVVPYTTLSSAGWGKRYRTSTGANQLVVFGVCHDLAGNSFAVGSAWANVEAHTTLGASVAFVMKFDASGNRLWIRFLDSAYEDVATSCATDSTGNVLVGGHTIGLLGTFGTSFALDNYFDAYISKFDSSGLLLWVRQFTSPSNTDCTVRDVAVDSLSNVYVAGYFNKTGSYPMIGLKKLSTSGAVLWERTFSNSNNFPYTSFASSSVATYSRTSWGSSEIESNGKIVDCTASGTCYLAFSALGSSLSADLGNNTSTRTTIDVFVFKVDTEGNRLWTSVLGTTSTDYVHALTLDSMGNVWIGGSTDGSLDNQPVFGDQDCMLVKLSSSGERLFARTFGSNQQQLVYALTADGTGAVYAVVQQYQNTGSSNDIEAYFDGVSFPYRPYGQFSYIIKMDSFGNRLWTEPVYAGYMTTYSSNGPHLAVLSVDVDAEGSVLWFGGKAGGLFNEASFPFSSNEMYPGGFISTANPSTACNATEFDSLMTEINDLLYALDISV